MSGTNTSQDADFAEQLWLAIKDNLEEALEHNSSWVLDWVAENFEPEDVYSEGDLQVWAESHGYVLEEE